MDMGVENVNVHDCGHSRPEAYSDGVLKEHYALTMEPGLYLQPNDELVPEELRGLCHPRPARALRL